MVERRDLVAHQVGVFRWVDSGPFPPGVHELQVNPSLLCAELHVPCACKVPPQEEDRA